MNISDPNRVRLQHIALFNHDKYRQIERGPYLSHAKHFRPAEKCQRLRVEEYLRNPRTQNVWQMKYPGPQKGVLWSPCNKENENKIMKKKSLEYKLQLLVLI